MSARRLKLVLLATMAVGAVGAVSVPGVYAIFTAQTRNTQATALSGTLTSDLVVAGGAPCYSYGGGAGNTTNVNTGCDALITFSTSAELYPGEPKTTTVTVRNDGSLDTADLVLFMPGGCTPGQTQSAPVNTGNPCAAGGMQFYVQETTGSGPKCWFPAAAGACSFTADLASFATRTTAGTALDLGPGPAAQQSRTFTIGVQEPSNAANTLQGRAATFALNWHLNS